jgi:hypothetical protein
MAPSSVLISYAPHRSREREEGCMRRPFVLASLVATLALAPALAGDTKDAYGWKFSKGDKVRYGYTYNLEMKVDAMMVKMTIHQNARLELTEETKEVKDDGSATIEATLDRILLDIEIPGMMGGPGSKVKFDTAKKAEEGKKEEKKDDDGDDEAPKGRMPRMPQLTAAQFDGLRDVIGQKFTFKMAKDGTISDVQGLDEISKKATLKVGGAAGMVGGGTIPLLDPEVLTQTLDLHCHVFPSGDAGESWKIPTKITLPNTGVLEFKRTITPKGEDKLVQTASKPELTPAKPGANGNPMAAILGKPKVKDTGYDGTTTISKEKGRVVSDELVATLKTELSIDAGGMMGKKGGKKGGDDDDDDDAPKKDEKKKDDKKDEKKDDDDDDNGGGNGGGGGGMKVKLSQSYKLTLKYEILQGEKQADEKPAEKPAEPKKDEKKKDDDD